MTKNMTTGKPLKLILLFSLPMLLGNLFQQMYSMADTLIVGRTIGVSALAAVGSTGSIIFLIIGFAFGVTTGMSLVTAQRFGARDRDGVRRSLAVALVMGFAMAAIIAVSSFFLIDPILQAMRTPADIYDDARLYLIINFIGMLGTVLYNVLSNFLRAVGNSRTPLIFLVVASVLNVILDFVLILGFGMGVEGAAYATIFSQLISGLLCLYVVARKGSEFRFQKGDFRFGFAEVKEHLRLGLPMGFQSSIIAIGTIMVQYALNGLGTNAVAAFAAASKIDGIATLPLSTFGVAMSTYAAQNYGAGLFDRIRTGVRQITIVSLVISAVLGGVNILFGGVMAHGFVGVGGEVMELAHTALIVNGITYSLLGLLFIYRYTLQGLGKGAVPTVAGVMELIMRSFAAIVLAASFGYVGACIAGPLAWLGALIPLSLSYFATMRRLAPADNDVQAEAALQAAEA